MVTVLKSDSALDFKLSTHLLAVYLFLTPLDFFPIFPEIGVQRIFAFLPLLGSLFYVKSMRIYIDRYFFLPVIYTAFLIITSFYSFNVDETQQRILTTGTNIALILILSFLDYNSQEIRYLKKMIVFSGWLALALLVYTSRDIVAGRVTVAIGGAAEDYNNLVGYFIFTMIYYLDQLMNKKKLKYFAYVSIFLSAIFITGSRGGLIAVFGAALFYMLIWVRAQKLKYHVILRLILFISVLVLAVYFIFNMLPVELRERFIPTDGRFIDGADNRFEIWDSILDSFAAFPLANQLFGMGVGTVRHFALEGQVGHNIWLDSLIETGLFGTVFLFVFYFSFFKKAYTLKNHVVASSFFGYMILAMSLSLYRYRPLWNILLLILIIKNHGITEDVKNV